MSEKRNATQRIEDLEHALSSLYNTADNMARDLTLVKDAIKLLGNKLDAVVKASARGSLDDETIASIMVDNNVEELKNKVDTLISQGILVGEQSATATSFVVGREVDESGKVVNPRLQFTMAALQPEVREKLVGSMPGQTVTLQEGKLKFEVMEVYAITSPSQGETPTVTEESSVEPEESSEQAEEPAAAVNG